MKILKILPAGFAMFAMLFGAGNVVYPLLLGRDVGHQLFWGLLGFILIAACLPVIGLVSVLLVEGDYKRFFGVLGKWPARVLIFVCMAIIGPFAIIPRCTTIAHGALTSYISWLHMPLFSIGVGAVIFGATVRRTAVVDVLGKFLGPLKFLLLLSIVIVGLLSPHPLVQVGFSRVYALGLGVRSALGTADLLGTIFFGGLIFSTLRANTGERFKGKNLIGIGLKIGLIGASLLGIVYALFCIVAAYWGVQLVVVAPNEVFSMLARLVLGERGGLLANVTIAISCLTTSMALSVVFASYVQEEIFKKRISYLGALAGTIAVSTGMANVGFAALMQLLLPVISFLYPTLITLAVTHVIYRLWNINCIKIPVFASFVLTLIFKLLV